MKKKVETNIHIDKLKVCYKANETMFNYLSSKHKGDTITLSDYYISTQIEIHNPNDLFTFSLEISNLGNNDNLGVIRKQTITNVRAKILLADGTYFADLTVYNPSIKKGYIFIQLQNECLYNVYFASYLEYIQDVLQLEFNNLSYLEIAIDTNYNFYRKLDRYLRNTNFEIIYNENHQSHNKRMVGCNMVKGRTPLQTDKESTMYFGRESTETHANKLMAKVYDKRKEIENNNFEKQYIIDKERFTDTSTIYRIEIAIESRYLNRIVEKFRESDDTQLTHFGEIYNVLTDTNYLYFIYNYFMNKILYFKDKKTNKQIPLLEIINPKLTN